MCKTSISGVPRKKNRKKYPKIYKNTKKQFSRFHFSVFFGIFYGIFREIPGEPKNTKKYPGESERIKSLVFIRFGPGRFREIPGDYFPVREPKNNKKQFCRSYFSVFFGICWYLFSGYCFPAPVCTFPEPSKIYMQKYNKQIQLMQQLFCQSSKNNEKIT